MKELNQKEIQSVSGAADINATFNISLSSSLAGRSRAGIVGFLASEIIDELIDDNLKDNTSSQLSEQTESDSSSQEYRLPHFSAYGNALS